jgi:hypothetical protein
MRGFMGLRYSFRNHFATSKADWAFKQIFPTYIRAKGLNISASGGAIGSIIVAQVWPVAIQNIGSKTYFIFMATNLASIVVSRVLSASSC